MFRSVSILRSIASLAGGTLTTLIMFRLCFGALIFAFIIGPVWIVLAYAVVCGLFVTLGAVLFRRVARD